MESHLIAIVGVCRKQECHAQHLELLDVRRIAQVCPFVRRGRITGKRALVQQRPLDVAGEAELRDRTTCRNPEEQELTFRGRDRNTPWIRNVVHRVTPIDVPRY